MSLSQEGATSGLCVFDTFQPKHITHIDSSLRSFGCINMELSQPSTNDNSEAMQEFQKEHQQQHVGMSFQVRLIMITYSKLDYSSRLYIPLGIEK